MRWREKSVLPSQIHTWISAQKGKLIACRVRAQSRFLRFWPPWCEGSKLQVSTYLALLDVHFIGIIEGEWAHLGLFHTIFDPLHQGGQNCKNHNCAWIWHAISLPFWALIHVCIYEGSMLFSCHRIYVLHLGRCRCPRTKIQSYNPTQ